LDAEMACPFTMNEEYERLLREFEELLLASKEARGPVDDHRLFPADFVRKAAEEMDGVEQGAEAAMTRRLQVSLHAYQHVLQSRLFDSIPIDARHRVMFQLHARLAPTLLRDEAALLPLIAEERPDVAATRSETTKRVSTLTSALRLLERSFLEPRVQGRSNTDILSPSVVKEFVGDNSPTGNWTPSPPSTGDSEGHTTRPTSPRAPPSTGIFEGYPIRPSAPRAPAPSPSKLSWSDVFEDHERRALDAVAPTSPCAPPSPTTNLALSPGKGLALQRK